MTLDVVIRVGAILTHVNVINQTVVAVVNYVIIMLVVDVIKQCKNYVLKVLENP